MNENKKAQDVYSPRQIMLLPHIFTLPLNAVCTFLLLEGTNKNIQPEEQQQYGQWCSYIEGVIQPTFRDVRCAIQPYVSFQTYCAIPGTPSLNARKLSRTAPAGSGSTLKRYDLYYYM